MTDEKIIIDGVDVSECEYFDYENEGTKECYAHLNECEANNCYFKQLKHTETKLKIEKKYRGITKRLINLLRTKEQECNDLISENDFLLQKLEVKETKDKILSEVNNETKNNRKNM